MPYIKEAARAVQFLSGPTDAGELNYGITMLCIQYLTRPGTERNYARLNEIIGALEACKLEFYRRAVAPYEDTKIVENGDVY